MAKASTRLLYRTYVRFARYGFWKQNKFTATGNILIYAVILTACLGLDTFRSMVYQLFSLLVSLFAASALLSLRQEKGLCAKRILPEYGSAGIPIGYTILIENRTNRLKQGFEIRERLGNTTPSLKDFSTAREPFEHLRNAWDRKLKVQRWNWLVRKSANARVARIPVPPVMQESKIEVIAELVPLNRGYIYLKGFTFLKKEPLGLMRAVYHTTREERLLILPRRYKVPDLVLPGSRKHHRGGVALTSKVGNADEFISLREYRPGDPMRRIHWKSLAKTGKLIIRENQDEHFVRHALILDTHVPRGEASDKFEAAVSLAASYVSKINTKESLLDLFFAGSRIFHYASGRGLSGSRKFLEILALIQPATEKTFQPVSQAVLKYQSLLSGTILIFSSLDQDRLELINRLKAGGTAVTAFLITDAGSAAPSGRVHLLDYKNMQTSLNRLRQPS